ncbi:alkylation response protein AidB-like acyl-CoA dehydrogenase [Paraburkholderia caballeronis]|uniref:acyl-CoA dehydrogenase family protein n=1 Tax=Paraburkholderia caballeronis TaxID=416943 RepID=UPI0010E11ED1|nr:acyl-CoA dehydrogenase family protein [Paraburkholderia caballeronis]TDV39073.1 alkylation response protein AidB-like acyl-CoA dehydrogenase [Paraburkholderia caballeronis]
MNAPHRHLRHADHHALIAAATELGQAFAEQAADHDRTGDPPAAQFDALLAAGLLRANIAAADGGFGAGLAVSRAIVGEIARGDPSVALILAMHYSQHAMIVRSERDGLGEWPHALARRLTRASLTGRALINAAQVEPALGSPSHGGLPDTIAQRDGDRWRLTGHKLYVTGVPLLSWINVLARTDEPEPRLGHFLVPRDAPGVRIVETWDPIGMRATASHDVVLEDVAVPHGDVVALKPARLGLQRDPHATAWYFSLIGSIYDGAARAARDWLVSFVNERRPSVLGGASLATVPTVQETVGRIDVLLTTNDWLLRSHADALDASDPPVSLAAAIKHTVIDNSVAAVEAAIELAGNHGLARRHPLERHHRNVLCSRIHAPPNQLIRVNAGRAALGV